MPNGGIHKEKHALSLIFIVYALCWHIFSCILSLTIKQKQKNDEKTFKEGKEACSRQLQWHSNC